MQDRAEVHAEVRASVRYCVDTGVKPVTATTGPGGRLRRRTGGQDDPREVVIRDARTSDEIMSLETHGFTLAEAPAGAPVATMDLWDEQALRRDYYPATEGLIARVSGAARVVIFDHTLRSGDPERQARHYAREPVHVVHNDYTERSGPWRVEDVLPEEAPALLQRRFAIIQVWRPIGGPVLTTPLALCDARSVAPRDWIAAERRHPTRVGEIYQVAHNPAHRWWYFPAMTQREALVFRVYDSDPARSRFTPHTSFRHPSAPPTAAPRESVELRALAFF